VPSGEVLVSDAVSEIACVIASLALLFSLPLPDVRKDLLHAPHPPPFQNTQSFTRLDMHSVMINGPYVDRRHSFYCCIVVLFSSGLGFLGSRKSTILCWFRNLASYTAPSPPDCETPHLALARNDHSTHSPAYPYLLVLCRLMVPRVKQLIRSLMPCFSPYLSRFLNSLPLDLISSILPRSFASTGLWWREIFQPSQRWGLSVRAVLFFLMPS